MHIRCQKDLLNEASPALYYPKHIYPKGDPVLACPSVECVAGVVLQLYRNFPQWRL